MGMEYALDCLLNGRTLDAQELKAAFSEIMQGRCDDIQVGALLTALKLKGETSAELFAAATAMREVMTPVEIGDSQAVDIVGTGGDGANLFNVSTAASVVCAAAGVKVAKHGNRSVSSSSGAADLLEVAGVNLALSAKQVGRCIEELGLGFMFAPNHHNAMRFAAPARASLKQRSIFNLLGPLTNPAGVIRHVIGVYDERWLEPVALALKELGSEHLLVVHSKDGLDEISLAADTSVCELRNGKISTYKISPEQLGINRAPLDGLSVNRPEDSLALFMLALTSPSHKAAQMVALNAGAAIYVGGLANSITEGVEIALDTISSGMAEQKLKDLCELSNLMGDFT